MRSIVNYLRTKLKSVRGLMKCIGKDLIGAILFFLLVLVFASGVARLLNATLVPFLFSQVSSGIVTDTAIIALLLILFIKWSGKILKAYVPSFRITLIFIFLSTLYAFRNQIFEYAWSYARFEIFPDVNYFSIVYILLLGQLLFYGNNVTGFHRVANGAIAKVDVWFNKKFPTPEHDKKEKIPNKGFYCDEPISETEKGETDELGYTKYAERISKNLLVTKSIRSFAIGINGKWGSGKTSFMNLMKRAMNGRDFIKVDFEPWNSQTPNAIVQDFFDTLRAALSPYHGDVGNELERYTEKLIDVDDNRITRGLKNALNIGGDKGSTEYSEKIEASIREIGKKIVVFIDDTDRLNKNEIFEVLRLIRNTASFSDTFFVVAYDRSYLTETINEIHKPHLYLEKIFQVEISLPLYKEEILQSYLLDLLKAIPETNEEDLTNLFTPNPYLVQILRYGLKSLRDVSRLVNSLKLNYLPIANQLLLRDSLFIETLRLKHPDLIAELASKQQKYFTLYGSVHSPEHHKLFLKSKNDNPNDPVCKNYEETVLYDQFKNHCDVFGFETEEDFKSIIGVFYNWFPKYISGYDDSSRAHLSIINPSRFDLYFRYSLFASDIDEGVFEAARKTGKTDLFKLLDNVKDDTGLKEFAMRLNIIQLHTSQTDLQNIVETQVKAYELAKSITDWKLRSSVSGALFLNVATKLRDTDGDIVRSLFQNNVQEYKSFLTRLFKSKSENTIGLLHRLARDERKQNIFQFPLSHDELFKLSCTHFKILISKQTIYTPEIWDIFLLLEYPHHKSIPKDQSAWLPYTNEGRILITNVILRKFPREILLSAIELQHGTKNRYGIKPTLIYPFVTGENLLDAVKDVTYFDEKEEFLGFLHGLAELDFKPQLDYTFDKIKPGTYN